MAGSNGVTSTNSLVLNQFCVLINMGLDTEVAALGISEANKIALSSLTGKELIDIANSLGTKFIDIDLLGQVLASKDPIPEKAKELLLLEASNLVMQDFFHVASDRCSNWRKALGLSRRVRRTIPDEKILSVWEDLKAIDRNKLKLTELIEIAIKHEVGVGALYSEFIRKDNKK